MKVVVIMACALAWLVLGVVMGISPPVSDSGRGSGSQLVGWICALAAAGLIVAYLYSLWRPPDPDSHRARRDAQIARMNAPRARRMLPVFGAVGIPFGALIILDGVRDHNPGWWAVGGLCLSAAISSLALIRYIDDEP
jgi:hypothetical protein